MTANTDDPRIVAGLAAQGATRDAQLARGERHVGWKAGLGTAAAMERVGTDACVTGFLTDATQQAPGAAIALDGFANPLLEAELAVRLGVDLAPDATREQARAAIDAAGPAIEVVDLGAVDDLEAVLAGNVFHRAFLLGELRPLAGDVDALRLHVRVDDGPPLADVDPRDVIGDVVDVVRAIAAQLPLAGARLRAGDVIILGAATTPTQLAGVAEAVVGVGEAEVSVRFG